MDRISKQQRSKEHIQDYDHRKDDRHQTARQVSLGQVNQDVVEREQQKALQGNKGMLASIETK